MSDDLHNIDDLFKKALEEHTELPSGAVWDNIDKTLDKKKVVSISKKYNKLKWAAAILLLFSFGMAMYVLHIRMKDKELVKQTNGVRNLKNQHSQTKSGLKDLDNLAKKDNGRSEKVKINKEFKPQKKNNNIPVIKDTKTDHVEDKTTVDNLNQRNKQMPGNWRLKLPSKGNAGKHITKQTQKKLLVKNKPVIKPQPQSAGIDSANKNENPVGSVASNSHKGILVDKEPERESNGNFVSSKEKYFSRLPVIFELKEALQMLAKKPISEILQIPANNTMRLEPNKPVFIKQGKSVHLKQGDMKNSSVNSLSAMAFFSPDLVITNVRNDHPLFREEDSHEIEKDEKIKSSYTVGVLIDYNSGKNWKLESGVTFSTRFTDIEPKTIYARPDNNGNINYRFNCSAGYSFVTLKPSSLPPVSGDSIRSLTSKNILQYIGVPLVVKYMFGKGRFSVTPGAGISVNFLVKGKIETTIPTATGNESITSNDIQGLKSTYLSGLASFGAQYKLSKVFGLTFTPTARFALSPINKEAPVKTYLNSIGFATGIIIKL